MKALDAIRTVSRFSDMGILLSNARNAIRPLEGTVTIQVSRSQT